MSKREQLEEYFSQSLEVDTLLRLCPDDEDTIYQIVDLQAADVPCYILKITIYRSDDTMVDKFSQVAGNVPVTNNDPNRRYTVINGYPVVLNFAKEPNPGVFERVRDILLATSYTKKTS